MKISLVYPPSQELNLKGYPLGLAYISASLKKNHKVDIYDYNGRAFSKSLHAFFSCLKATKPDLVGISFNSFNRWGAYKLIEKIKKINRKTLVVLGGVHPSTMVQQIFQHFYEKIDFVIQSEGDQSFRRLCDALERNEDYRNISGLVYKEGEKGFKANPVTDVIGDLDTLPLPDYSYASQKIQINEFGYLITSRGCPVNCSFCSTSTFWGQRIRMNSPERVGEEVDYVKSLGARRFFFYDDTFNLGIERTIKLAEILKQKNIEYAVSCRVRPVNEEMVAKLVESGCRHITWGVESLSDKILKTIDKKITKEEVKNAFDICAKYADKLTTGAFFCVGVPGETEETINESIEYLNKYIKSTHGPGASILYILPGTRVYRDLVKNGKFDERIWLKTDSVYYYTGEHSMKTLNSWRKRINRSGIRLSTSLRNLLDYALEGEKENLGPVRKRIRRTRHKISRFINMMRHRY
ncbi:MAG: radical SAM protein [Candidatus Omnitrophota bacterium]